MLLQKCAHAARTLSDTAFSGREPSVKVKMKIKCFSKRKLNVRISKTKIKCAILGFSQNCCILGKSREKLVKFIKNSAKIQQKFSKFWQILQHFVKISKKRKTAIFNEKIEIRE